MNYETYTYAHKTLPHDLLLQYGRLRYNSFSNDDPYVNLDHKNKTEFDIFDDGVSDPFYVMVTADDGPSGSQRLVSAMRFIGCDKYYDIEQPSWSYLTDGVELPKSPEICESSRWVGKSSNTREGLISSGLLNMATMDLAAEQGWLKTLGAPAEAGSNWLKKRGATVEHLGKPHYSEHDDYTIQLTLVGLDEIYFKLAMDMFTKGVGQKAIARVSLDKIAA